jgi:hypothetical protein
VSDDPRERFLTALKRGLRCGPLKRRRVVREIRAHLDDTVGELEAGGMPESSAIQEALRRLGDVATIISAFREIQPERGRWSWARRLRSPAWVAVGAMSLVTVWAAELPQASGARPTTPARRAIDIGHQDRPHARPRRRGDDRSVLVGAPPPLKERS